MSATWCSHHLRNKSAAAEDENSFHDHLEGSSSIFSKHEVAVVFPQNCVSGQGCSWWGSCSWWLSELRLASATARKEGERNFNIIRLLNLRLLEGTAVTPQERDCGLVEVPLGSGSGVGQGEVGHRACKMSLGGLLSCLVFYWRSNGRGKGEKRSWEKEWRWWRLVPHRSRQPLQLLCTHLTLFLAVVASSL